jgi:dihydrofolate reductase
MEKLSQQNMKIALVVAIAQNGAIGAGGDLLWRLPADMKYFKEVTMGHHVLMGRKTYESIPDKFQPLLGRTNLVVSRRKDYQPKGAMVFDEVNEALRFAEAHGETTVMVIGGGEIYRQTLPIADVVYLTRVHHDFPEADTHFHFLPDEAWRVKSREFREKDDKNTYDIEFIVYEKVQ